MAEKYSLFIVVMVLIAETNTSTGPHFRHSSECRSVVAAEAAVKDAIDQYYDLYS